LIRHARLKLSMAAAFAVSALPVAVIEPPFGTLLMPAVGAPPLLDSRLLAAGHAAIALPAIAAPAEKENCATLAAEADP
jgi:hypothetical protein